MRREIDAETFAKLVEASGAVKGSRVYAKVIPARRKRPRLKDDDYIVEGDYPDLDEAVAEGKAEAWRAAVHELVEMSTFVPEDRRPIYERALVAGFEGDGVLFLHLIIPQLENSLRAVCQQAGLPVTSMDAHGVLEERDLNLLLRMEGASGVFGEDLLWEMRSVLVEKTGPNLWNRLCHGLLASADFERPAGNTLLWLTVFLLLRYRSA